MAAQRQYMVLGQKLAKHITLADKRVIPKPMIEWAKEESNEPYWNNKGLYTITIVFNANEYRRIQACQTQKEAWDILAVMSECGEKIKGNSS